MNNFIHDYGAVIESLATAILVALIAVLFGLWAYFRQKEYELVRERYLEKGVDVLIHQVETALTAFQFNFTHSLLVLKTFRDLGSDMPLRLLEAGFQEIDAISMVPTRNYLLQELIGTDLCYKIHQLMVVFIHDATNFFLNDLCSILRVKLQGSKEIGIKATRQEIVDVYEAQCMGYEEQAHKYWIFLGNLQNIAFAFEKQRFTFAGLEKFRDNRRVMKSLEVLDGVFKEYISNNNDEMLPQQAAGA